MRISSILGINARNRLFGRYNSKRAKHIASSKILTKRILSKAGLPTPKLYKIFRKPGDVLNFDWESLPSSFALKPARGFGGEGITVVKAKTNGEETLPPVPRTAWVTTERKVITVDDLKLHTLDILEGAYSIGNVPDVAYIEEYVGRHKTFRKFSFRGTPDIRIIVFNKVPVMAMLRLPTKDSGGRANLHQGAIGVGVDMATGITTYAIWYDRVIKYKPETQKKLNGIRIPDWDQILKLAVASQEISGLFYLGVDIVLHPEKGPMVLELNAHPGLSIQLSNLAGLRKRLERVEDLDVRDVDHGVKIAKALFTGHFSDQVKAREGLLVINAIEQISVLSKEGKKVSVMAKVDTGAWGTSIDREFAKEIGILDKESVLWYKNAVSALGKQRRPVINVVFFLSGKKIKTTATIADRGDLTYKMIIGRSDLTGFLVDPEVLVS